jgi:3-mercaptopyruvate sulfurtransferase SseA
MDGTAHGAAERHMSTELGKQWAAIGAMCVAIAAALTLDFGRGDQATTRRAPVGQAPAWLQQIETGEDHIDAEELARELLRARGDVTLIDLRPADEFRAWHLPGARNLTVPATCGAAGKAVFDAQPRLVVLCSNGVAHPGQAWVALQQQGRRNVKVLAGGLDEFKAVVLTPPSLRDGATEADAKRAGAAHALRRAFFAGARTPSPKAGWATDPTTLTAPTMVSPQWLAERITQVAVLDVRPAADFAALHLPGARSLEASRVRVRNGDRDHLLVDDPRLAQTFGELGLTADTPVVLCADDKVQDATFVALALLHLGHRAVAVLEGGIPGWASEGRPLTDEVVAPQPATYQPRPGADDFTITTDELAKAVRAGATKVLDVRPPAMYRGEQSTEARPGHIPGAVNRPFSVDLQRDATGQWLLPRVELQQKYGALFSPEAPITVSCRTGHTASHTFFVLRHLLGYDKVRWYNGSWTEWAARPELPAATGDQ